MSKPAKHVLIAASLIGAFASSPASANCGDTPMLGSICIVAFNFCPNGFADANGQILSISQNSALFALLGTTYGGNGQTTFALPNLQGRVPVGIGQGAGLSPIQQGEQAGQETVTLSAAQMPAHTHSAQLRGTASNGNTDSPAGAVPAKLPRSNIYSSGAAGDAMGASALTIGTAGNGQPVSVRNPYLGLRYCIALQGIFPSRP